VDAGGVGGGVGNLELDAAGDGCGGCGRGVGGVSSWRFLFPNVSLFLTTAGVAGDGCGGCGRCAGGVSSWRFLFPNESLFLTTAGVTGGVVRLNR
jgi:predicted Fe-S protein YdhL (DUF1289 family)